MPLLVAGIGVLGAVAYFVWAGTGDARSDRSPGAPTASGEDPAATALGESLGGAATGPTNGSVSSDPSASDEGALDRRAPVELPGDRFSAGDPSVRRRIDELLASSDVRARFQGLKQLALVAPAELAGYATTYVEETADDPRAALHRLATVELLGDVDDPSAVDALLVLYDRDEPALKHATAVALAKHGDDSLIDRELFALHDDVIDPDGAVRAQAARAAGKLGHRNAVPLLMPLLDDTNSDVRVNAIDGLWLSSDPTVIGDLERMLDDPVAEVRERARRAIDALRLVDELGGGAGGR